MMTTDQADVLLQEKTPLLPLSVEAKGSCVKLRVVPRICLAFVRLLALVSLALGFCIIFAVHGLDESPEENTKTSVCLTPGCVLAAAEILQSRSPNYTNISPCDDFRSYVCEGFDNTHDLRPDQTDVVSFTLLAERGQALLRHILEAPLPIMMTLGEHRATDERNFKKLQNAYKACQNESAISGKRLEPLTELIKSVLNTFQKHEDGETSLSQTLSHLMSIGVQPLVEFEIRADEKDPDINVLYINAPYSLGLPTREFYEDGELVQKYMDMITQVQKGFRHEMNMEILSTGTTPVKALVALEVRLAAASPSEEEREDVQKYYNPRTLQNVTSAIPQLDIPAMIKTRNPEFDAVKLIVGSPSYLAALSSILDSTEIDVVKSYLTWKIIQNYASGVEADAVIPLKRFNNILQGKEPDAKPERWRTCLRHVDNGLGWILSRLFVEKAFSEEAKKYGDQVILDIKAEFVRKLDAAEWMTKDVRQLAIDKVHNIIQKIGYPTASPDIRDPNQLAKYYEAVNVSTHNYFANKLSMASNDVAMEWAKATQPVDRNEWGMTASTVNAYYNPAGNEIVFPAGIMQSAMFYPPEIPNYLTYGAFGAVSGHELSHAFDSTGRHFDQNGNYTEWWDSETIAEFKHKAECFVEQYGNYTITGPDGKEHHVNGRLTLGENLADAGGLSAAFNAWKRREAEKPAQLLPGLLEYTKEQIFFMAYGQVWCGKTREAEQLKRLYSDPHSPNAARVLLTVANSDQFRESFNCEKKEAACKLW